MIGLFLLAGTLAVFGLYPLVSAIIWIRYGCDLDRYLFGESLRTLPGVAGHIPMRDTLIGIGYFTFVWEGYSILLAAAAFVPETAAARMFIGFLLFCWMAPFVAQPICGRKLGLDLPGILF